MWNWLVETGAPVTDDDLLPNGLPSRLFYRSWLDRPSPKDTHWYDWFEYGDYLGETSARTGPDNVKTDQPCNCNQCRPGDK